MRSAIICYKRILLLMAVFLLIVLGTTPIILSYHTDKAVKGWKSIRETSYFGGDDCPTGVRCTATCTTNMGEFTQTIIVGSRVKNDGSFAQVYAWSHPDGDYGKRIESEGDFLDGDEHMRATESTNGFPNGKFNFQKQGAQRHDQSFTFSQQGTTITATYHHHVERDDPCPTSYITYRGYASSDDPDNAKSECTVYENRQEIDSISNRNDDC